MRPAILNTLFTDVSALSGIGPRIKEILSGRIGTHILDLIFHLPTGIIDRRKIPDFSNYTGGGYITALITVDKHIPPYKSSRRPYRILCSNETGKITLVFFNAHGNYLEKQLPVGQERVISGKAEIFDGKLQMTHPDYIALPEDLEKIKRVEPVYPLTQGLSLKKMGAIESAALTKLPDLPEWLNQSFIKKQSWQNWKDSIIATHHPSSLEDINFSSPARSRLAYDELLANQLALAISRNLNHKQKGLSLKGDGNLCRQIVSTLPFKLTNGQRAVLKEIFADMKSKNRMLRLLQGDVGSGKTIVALLTMLNAVECGKQAAIMAPTELLAMQHVSWMESALKNAGLEKKVKITLLTGSKKSKIRKDILAGLESGKISIIVGTHALFQENVEFKDLALVIIDEQHRFGVRQRLALSSKGNITDILLMSATPIPRTLTMTLYGDMEISNLKEKPPGRIAVDTRAMPISRIAEVAERLKKVTEEGKRAYWVCPLIEDSEENTKELSAAETRYNYLKKIFGNRVGLVHGRIKGEEREKTMMEFKTGKLDVLVATTVIEVGVDVPEASIMVIEQADQFGLSQLHQLRGRVGRKMNSQSSCILLYSKNIGLMGKRRLKIMRETEDGFRIAEEDLVLRGSGELLGTKQSGMPDFLLAVLPEQSELLSAARDDTKLIINKDPDLKTERGQALRILLYLFEYDNQLKYLRSA